MVTPEERITRLEAIQEANTQQLALVLSRVDQVLNLIEAVRQEARDANELARREARERDEATRQEARERDESAGEGRSHPPRSAGRSHPPGSSGRQRIGAQRNSGNKRGGAAGRS